MREEHHSQPSNSAIEAEISQTRRRMDTTLDRLADRLQPRHLLNDLVDFWHSRRSRHGDGHHIAEAVRENTRKAGQTLVHQVRDNPVPALLIGAGVAWLIFDRSRSDDRTWAEPAPDLYSPEEDYGIEPTYDDQSLSTTESVGEKLTSVGEKAKNVAGRAGQKLRETGQHLRERAREQGQQLRSRTSHVRHQMQDRFRDRYERTQERLRQSCQRTQAQLQETADQHPLSTGAACLAIGLLAGFLLPKSRREDQMFGDVSDAVRHRVKEVSQDLVEKGKHVAEAATHAARSEAERQGLTPDRIKEGVKAVSREAAQTAQETAQKEGLSPQSLKGTSQTPSDTAGSGSQDPSLKQSI
jgi:ElaB/YqjD/DUF883 family membrane-anchored ribosome-binding protein